MSGLTIYGVTASRAFRNLWLAEELGLDYSQDAIGHTDPKALADNASLKRLNPNMKIPAVDDNGFHLWESMAINFYLARKFGGPLAPVTLEEDALMLQWTLWGLSEVEPSLAQIIRRPLDRDAADAAEDEKAKTLLARALEVLDAHLTERCFLVADRFTVGDLNLASILCNADKYGVGLGGCAHVATWLQGCMNRGPFAKVMSNW